jgi:hypothetical protein
MKKNVLSRSLELLGDVDVGLLGSLVLAGVPACPVLDTRLKTFFCCPAHSGKVS